MFNIFNKVIRNATGVKDWPAPNHWTDHDRRSTYQRQLDEAAKNRADLIRHARLPF